MEDKRTIHTYKASEKNYEKAMKICKRRKQYLSGVIELVIDALADDKNIVAQSLSASGEEIVNASILSLRSVKKIKPIKQ